MNDINMEERIAIKDSARTLKKYGSTSSNSKRCESFIKHNVDQSDTLQGLALKYGVTTEQIRRANTLWANDSLFLRKILLIPSPSGPSRNGRVEPSVNAKQSGAGDSHQLFNYNNNNNNSMQNESSCSIAGEDSDEQQLDQSYNDFLVKIDCAIASTKSQVMISHGNSQFTEGDSIFWRRKSAALSRLKQQKQHKEEVQGTARDHCTEDDQASGSSNNDTADFPTTAVVMTQGRKVRNSLQKLEKQQNDIFEL